MSRAPDRIRQRQTKWVMDDTRPVEIFETCDCEEASPCPTSSPLYFLFPSLDVHAVAGISLLYFIFTAGGCLVFLKCVLHPRLCSLSHSQSYSPFVCVYVCVSLCVWFPISAVGQIWECRRHLKLRFVCLCLPFHLFSVRTGETQSPNSYNEAFQLALGVCVCVCVCAHADKEFVHPHQSFSLCFYAVEISNRWVCVCQVCVCECVCSSAYIVSVIYNL